jgi:YD repeat-containing protein
VTYDDDGNHVVAMEHPTGLQATFRYDDQKRLVRHTPMAMRRETELNTATTR